MIYMTYPRFTDHLYMKRSKFFFIYLLGDFVYVKTCLCWLLKFWIQTQPYDIAQSARTMD